MDNFNLIKNELLNLKNEDFASWFKPFIDFKNTNDEILGIRVPILRKLAKKYKEIDEKTLVLLLTNKIREMKQLALFIMILKSKKESDKMAEIYLKHIKHINNWDLIDVSASHILSPVVSKAKLIELSNSKNMWENRISMVSTIYYIKKGDFDLTLKFAKKFINHPHHLIHKATGWMLREVGKKDKHVLIEFLKQYENKMPSVMKSYAKERLKKG